MKPEAKKALLGRRIAKLEAEVARLRHGIAELRSILDYADESRVTLSLVKVIADIKHQPDLLHSISRRKPSFH